MSDNILSAICRAALCRDTDRTSMTLSGVSINPDAGELVRCEATNGQILAVCHAHKAGIEISAPVIISAEHLPRLISFHARNRRALDDIACRRNPTKPGRPIIISRQIDGDAPGTKVLEFSIPALDDVCRVKLVTGCAFPVVRGQETKGKVWKVGIGGSHFNLKYLSLIPKVLPGQFLPYTTGKNKTIWRSQTSGDYVLVMPISVPDSEGVELFPEASEVKT
jgi:hypothetical protein